MREHDHGGSEALLTPLYGVLSLTSGPQQRDISTGMVVLLENLLRNEDGVIVHADQVRAFAAWDPAAEQRPSHVGHPLQSEQQDQNEDLLAPEIDDGTLLALAGPAPTARVTISDTMAWDWKHSEKPL